MKKTFKHKLEEKAGRKSGKDNVFCLLRQRTGDKKSMQSLPATANLNSLRAISIDPLPKFCQWDI